MTDSAHDVRAALAALVVDEPELPDGAQDIERRGIRLRNRRRALVGSTALASVLAAGVAFTVWPGGGPASGPNAPPQHAAPQSPAGQDPARGAQLATGFPIMLAMQAAEPALPDGLAFSDQPMDVGWKQLDVFVIDRRAATLTLMLTNGDTLTLKIADEACTVTSGSLSPEQAEAVAAEVCEAWELASSPDLFPDAPVQDDSELAAS